MLVRFLSAVILYVFDVSAVRKCRLQDVVSQGL